MSSYLPLTSQVIATQSTIGRTYRANDEVVDFDPFKAREVVAMCSMSRSRNFWDNAANGELLLIIENGENSTEGLSHEERRQS